MREEHSAGMVIYYEDPHSPEREYLLLQYASGYWDLPKGKLEKNETSLDAAIREVKEETNLTLRPDHSFEQKINYFFKDREGKLVHKTVLYFCAESQTKEVSVSEEHLTYLWLPFNEAFHKVTYSNAKQLLQMVEQHLNALKRPKF